MKAIVFSKDRPMQLDLLLASLEKNAPGVFDVTVLWNAPKEEFYDAYHICFSEHPDVDWEYENGLTYQVRSLLRDGEFVSFFTDDDVLYRPLEDHLWLGRECISLSLRLGRNTTYCYPHGREQAFPIPPNGPAALYVWEWERAEGDFSYPMSLDGHIFRSSDLLPIVEECHFTTPNWLEVRLMDRAKEIGKPYMVCPPESCLVGLPLNRVQDEMPNRHGNTYPVQELNDRYLRGERIDLDALDFSDIRGAHQEIPLVFR